MKGEHHERKDLRSHPEPGKRRVRIRGRTTHWSGPRSHWRGPR